MKPLAVAAGAEGYINIMVWVFNGRFAISSPQPCQKCRIPLKQNCSAHRHNTTCAQKRILHPHKQLFPNTR
jgi:hypothetical protein